MWEVLKRNPVSSFAVLCVAATGIFLAYMAVWQTNILSSPTWCAKAMGAEKMLPDQTVSQTLEALRSCNNLLMVQVQAVALDSHINHGGFVLMLLFLVVVVVAGARASAKLSASGMEFNVGKHEADKAAEHVVAGAKEAAAEVKTGTVAPKPDDPKIPDYAKP